LHFEHADCVDEPPSRSGQDRRNRRCGDLPNPVSIETDETYPRSSAGDT
jgi:hypothetical protein